MRFDVITLFPQWFEPLREHGVTRRAFDSGALELHLWPLRDYAEGAYRRVDDRPFGGGPGMVMLAEPLRRCWEAVCTARHQAGCVRSPTLLFAPQGQRLEHAWVAQQAQAPDGAILLCGRYEGLDQRFIDQCVDAQISLGDFVLSGGELAALALLDAVARLLPGVLQDPASHAQDSFNPAVGGLLDCPHYTRPERWSGPQGEAAVPGVLLSGHHGQIERWRQQQRLLHTARWRPDLLVQARARGQVTRADWDWLQAQGTAQAPEPGLVPEQQVSPDSGST